MNLRLINLERPHPPSTLPIPPCHWEDMMEGSECDIQTVLHQYSNFILTKLKPLMRRLPSSMSFIVLIALIIPGSIMSNWPDYLMNVQNNIHRYRWMKSKMMINNLPRDPSSRVRKWGWGCLIWSNLRWEKDPGDIFTVMFCVHYCVSVSHEVRPTNGSRGQAGEDQLEDSERWPLVIVFCRDWYIFLWQVTTLYHIISQWTSLEQDSGSSQRDQVRIMTSWYTGGPSQ